MLVINCNLICKSFGQRQFSLCPKDLYFLFYCREVFRLIHTSVNRISSPSFFRKKINLEKELVMEGCICSFEWIQSFIVWIFYLLLLVGQLFGKTFILFYFLQIPTFISCTFYSLKLRGLVTSMLRCSCFILLSQESYAPVRLQAILT